MIADEFSIHMGIRWESPNGPSALDVAKERGAILHRAHGDVTIAEFMDGSFALLANNGNRVLTTWLEEDVMDHNLQPKWESQK